MNAGAIFYLTDRVSTLRDGVAKARDSIRTGDVLRKLVEWIAIQSDASGQGIERLQTVSGRAGLETKGPRSFNVCTATGSHVMSRIG